MWLEIPDKYGITEETCRSLRDLKDHIERHEKFAHFTVGMMVLCVSSAIHDEYGDLGIGVVKKVNPDERPNDDTMCRFGIYVVFPKVDRTLRLGFRDLKPVSSGESELERAAQAQLAEAGLKDAF